ncbi:hypothetical protein FB45DRAFT_1003342 [Roridomyces roridus]|uniref:MYND-type domain-containing protein n=1 Tax=Roridomyces roridus TaxID=1738132 RepID=A0AAD7BXS4_9AGAR|nr:hypothetical protein FB45DRAFT_1003342 [Roridomyces roridus]
MAVWIKLDKVWPSLRGLLISYHHHRFPLAWSDPRAWDEKWAKFLAEFAARLGVALLPTAPTFFLEACNLRCLTSKFSTHTPEQRHDLIQHTRSLRKSLCSIQMNMTRVAAPYFVGKERLRRRWMEATPETRGDLILSGLVNTCSAYPALHDARYYCAKEMDVESHRRDGRLFLDLLQEMMVQNPTDSDPDSPTYISHPAWDAMAADQEAWTSTDKQFALTFILAERNMLIGFVVLFALCSFLERPIPQLTLSKATHKPPKRVKAGVNPPLKAALRMLYGEEATKGFTQAARESNQGYCIQEQEMYAKDKQLCHSCRQPNDATTKYPRCKRCWDTVQREVLYCSSDCQKVDWKAGHKKECGRWLQFEDFTPSTPEQHSSHIGPPLHGFKRSGALIWQVSELNRLSPQYDYIVFLEYDCIYVSFPLPPIRAAFCACRDKALTTGDCCAVAMLAQFLLRVFVYKNDPSPQTIGVNPAAMHMMKQIMDEYELPEIVIAVNEMEQRMYTDGGRRPPLIVEAGISAAQWGAMASICVSYHPVFILERQLARVCTVNE